MLDFSLPEFLSYERSLWVFFLATVFLGVFVLIVGPRLVKTLTTEWRTP